MLVLALDTATPAITAGVVELTADALVTRGVCIAHDPRKHGELLIPNVLAACAEAGIALQDVEAVVTGIGPGPFTGLRVGMVTAASLADALGVPVHGVCSLDAIAVDAGPVAGPLLVVTDARRREVYWAAYDGGTRIDGPAVGAPAVVAARAAELGAVAAAGGLADTVGLPVIEPASPSPVGLVAAAAAALRSGAEPALLEPLYLRRPDAQEMSARKRVTAG